MDANALGKLFRGRDQSPEECEDLAEVMAQGWITVEERTYRSLPEPRPSSPLHHVWIDAHYRGGTEDHGDLKWWAWNWLRKQGDPDPQFEYDTYLWARGRADVAAPSIGCVVECGDTPARKVIQAFWEGDWKVFVLFPYMYVEDLAAAMRRPPTPRLYVFRPTETGEEELRDLFRRYTEGWQSRSKKINIFDSLPRDG